jgi:HK97 family phage major capsid protein
VTTTAIPTTSAELEEWMNDGERMTNVMKEGKFKEFVNAYQGANAKAAPDIRAEIAEQVQLGMAQFMKDNGEKAGIPPVDLSPGPAAQPRVHIEGRARRTSAQKALNGQRAIGRSLDGMFQDSAEFFRTTHFDEMRVNRSPELSAKRAKVAEIMNSFGSEVPADGGFLIPETLRSDLLQVALEEAVVRPRAQVIPMETLRVPIPMIDSTSNVSSVFGGVICYWTEEAAALVESQASFGRVNLDAKKLTGYAEIPNELLADAPAFTSFFDDVFPKALAWYEDIGFMNGTGVGEPRGFVNCSASVQVSASGQPAASITWENIVAMYARMLPTALQNAVWIASIDTFPQLATMALSVGTGGSAVWLGNTQQPGSAVPPVSILGRPVIFTEKTPALGTTGDINFVDLSYYLIGDRQMMQSTSSPHFKFSSDKTVFRIIERLDGQPWLSSAILPHNGANALSPFVQLASRP